jgi:hypothetical protein
MKTSKKPTPKVIVKPGIESLSFVRYGKMNDGKMPCMVFCHKWATGYQLLNYETIEQAQLFADGLNKSSDKKTSESK